ncbi:alpha/beta fold hydrolase [Streptomyces sp. CC224B]|uniref:thioesterase II family protein n=1 Tax=Streptomyces sp. CC224B TaxID=3044571 RepID=UPI0024A90133|nr:alpha/beta fold hydrolase [Streptomyces sp. CC224B]
MTVANAAAGAAWFRVFKARPAARLRLICFPHAGGAASAFHELAGHLPDTVEVAAVQYPGRQDRFTEPVPDTLDELAAELAGAVAATLDRPTAFFGHSMGATVAFEVARKLRASHPGAPVRLFASARKAPHVDTRRALTFADDEAVMDYIRALGGAGARLLDEPELRELVLPVLRADFRLIAGHTHTPGAPLACPVTVVIGDEDASCTPADAREWARHTVAGQDTHALPGGHFYLETAARQLADFLVARLDADVPGAAPAAASHAPAGGGR